MVLVVGHRGSMGTEPENTIRGFKKALDFGVDLVEFDVRMARDGKLVVIHNPRVDKTTNGRGKVRDFLFKDLRNLDAGQGEKIPTLGETVNLLKKLPIKMMLEIKEPDTAEKVVSFIKREGIQDRVLVVSFRPKVIKRIKEKDPSIMAGIIFFKFLGTALPLVKKLNADFACVYHLMLNKRTVKKFHNNNVLINAWPVNKPRDIKRMMKLEVDMITSNYPDRVLSALNLQKYEA